MNRLNAIQIAALAMLATNEQAPPLEAPARPRGALPTKLDIRTDSAEYCSQFDVFFNGVKQSACVVADVKNKRILRYKNAMGRIPVRGRTGKYETQHLDGLVEIKWKA